MEKADQLIQDDPAGRFDELVGRVSHISKEKLDKSLIAWPEHERVTRYRVIRTAAMGGGDHGDERRAFGGHLLRSGSHRSCFPGSLKRRIFV